VTHLSALVLFVVSLLASVSAAQRAVPRGDPRPGSEVGVPSSQPNVLIILGDDFNWTDFDSVDTPNLDGLAGQGMTFRRSYVFPVCSPTRYGALFGRYPRRDGIGEIVSFELPGPDNPTPPLELTSLAEVLRLSPRGRTFTGIFGKWHLGANPMFGGRDPDFGPYNFGALTPNLQGFDRWFGSIGNLQDYNAWMSVEDGVFAPSTEYASGAVLREFLEWWPAQAGPRFAYVAFHNAHADYHTPPPELLPPGYPAPPGQRKEFEAMIASLDFMVGRMLEVVDLSDTYVFFLTDNGSPRGVSIDDCPPRPGEPFNPFDCAKHTVFEPGIRVPLIVAGPEVVPGTESQALVSCVDLMATVCELLDVPSPGEDSVSFASTLRDPTLSARRYVFSEIFGEFDLFIGGPAMKNELAAIGERFKLRRINGVEKLYDLLLDPREAFPVPLSEPSVAQELAELRAVLEDPLDRALQAP
jgi:arylsulfatase A-like enzyme